MNQPLEGGGCTLTYNDAKSNITTIKCDAAADPIYSDDSMVMKKTNSFLLDTAKKHTLHTFLCNVALLIKFFIYQFFFFQAEDGIRDRDG